MQKTKEITITLSDNILEMLPDDLTPDEIEEEISSFLELNYYFDDMTF